MVRHGYLGHIPATTIRMYAVSVTALSRLSVSSSVLRPLRTLERPQPNRSNDKPNEIIHIKKYCPTTGFYGIPDIVAAKQAVAGNEFAARFNLDYFENKAVPRHVIILKGASLGTQSETCVCWSSLRQV